MRKHTQTVWLATDESGHQFIFELKPNRSNKIWVPAKQGTAMFDIGTGKFKQTWKDEAIKIDMSLRIK